MYEAYSYGQTPYNGINDQVSVANTIYVRHIIMIIQDVLSKVSEGYRMSPPEGTPKAVYNDIMMTCWDILPKQRPTFQEIIIKLRGILARLPKK